MCKSIKIPTSSFPSPFYAITQSNNFLYLILRFINNLKWKYIFILKKKKNSSPWSAGRLGKGQTDKTLAIMTKYNQRNLQVNIIAAQFSIQAEQIRIDLE